MGLDGSFATKQPHLYAQKCITLTFKKSLFFKFFVQFQDFNTSVDN